MGVGTDGWKTSGSGGAVNSGGPPSRLSGPGPDTLWPPLPGSRPSLWGKKEGVPKGGWRSAVHPGDLAGLFGPDWCHPPFAFRILSPRTSSRSPDGWTPGPNPL